MRRTCLLLTVAAFAAGCTAPMEISRFVDFPDSKELQECTGPATGPALKITYGDSKIIVDHILKVSKNDIIKIDLHPANNSEEGVDYKNLEIMLVGKSGNSQWLNRKLKSTESNNNKFFICVGNRSKGSYYYLIDVPGVGQIDPRVDVEL